MEIEFCLYLYSDPDTVSVSEEMSWHNISNNIGVARDSILPQVDFGNSDPTPSRCRVLDIGIVCRHTSWEK